MLTAMLPAGGRVQEAVLWMEWALFEMRLGDLTRARELFTEGAALTPLHVQLVEAWALMEMRDGQVCEQ